MFMNFMGEKNKLIFKEKTTENMNVVNSQLKQRKASNTSDKHSER